MTAPGVSTWDDPAGTHRPGSADYNGAALQDDSVNPPNPATMPTAGLLNTQSLTAVSIGKVVPNALLSVKFVSGNPVADSAAAAPSAVSTGTFTIARTGGGAANGDITITWPANTFPGALVQPTAHLNGTTPAQAPACSVVSNGVRVVIQDRTGAGVDLPFTVKIY